MAGITNTILKSLYCIPCIWTILCIGATFFANNYIRNDWVPGGSPTPSDGQVEGFESQATRIAWWDTTPLRIRYGFRAMVIGFVVWAAGAGIELIILTRV